MLHAVIDTNVLVSALLSPGSNPSRVLAMVKDGRVIPCFDDRILLEYEGVLFRSKFPFNIEDILVLLTILRTIGHLAAPPPLDIPFTDESDRKFYETAKYCCATLITGNLKHYPAEPGIMSPAAFLRQFP